ncbi:MAG: hypothetical protein RL367_751 [Pseudomonadota bacterium]
MRLEFSPTADADLVAIAGFIACDNVARAISFVEELQAACVKLIDYPHFRNQPFRDSRRATIKAIWQLCNLLLC